MMQFEGSVKSFAQRLVHQARITDIVLDKEYNDHYRFRMEPDFYK